MTFHLHRRALIGGLGLTLAAPAVLRAAEAAAPDYVEIATQEGRLRGSRENGVSIFKGVRYAAPPLGAARFKAPGRLKSWTGVRDALVFGAASIQAPNAGTLGGTTPNEDCLFLNLWTPATKPDGAKRAVMFYLHGGGFTSGSGNSRGQDGANLSRNNDVIVVETNHRLGLLGHLWLGDLLGPEYATSGNQSLFDMTAGLDWVKRNIEAFGGDPNNVMVWGESGGGVKTSSMLAFNPAAKLFHKASIESGPGIRMTPRDQAAATALFVLDKLGLTKADARKLLEIPADQLLAVQNGDLTPAQAAAPGSGGFSPNYWGLGGGKINSYAPVVDGRYLPHNPFDPVAPAISADKPLIIGGNKDEATFFLRTSPEKAAVFALDEAGLRARAIDHYGPTDGPAILAAYKQDLPGATPPQIEVAIESDAFSRTGSTWIAEKKVAQHRAPVFNYRLVQGVAAPIDAQTPYPQGAGHALDISLKFDNRGASAAEPDNGSALVATAKNMSRYWAGFAKTGIPHADGQPAWPAYNLTSRPIMLLKPQCEVVSDQYPNVRKVWSAMMARGSGLTVRILKTTNA
ncbi:MAG: carboxylesterase/lipase family protein [Caulobacteraceae bacterium]|nr:carboxylesterase/lipase family protein [Caulobacteraceae bacterium]